MINLLLNCSLFLYVSSQRRKSPNFNVLALHTNGKNVRSGVKWAIAWCFKLYTIMKLESNDVDKNHTVHGQKHPTWVLVLDFSGWNWYPTEVRNVSVFLLFEHYMLVWSIILKFSYFLCLRGPYKEKTLIPWRFWTAVQILVRTPCSNVPHIRNNYFEFGPLFENKSLLFYPLFYWKIRVCVSWKLVSYMRDVTVFEFFSLQAVWKIISPPGNKRVY